MEMEAFFSSSLKVKPSSQYSASSINTQFWFRYVNKVSLKTSRGVGFVFIFIHCLCAEDIYP